MRKSSKILPFWSYGDPFLTKDLSSYSYTPLRALKQVNTLFFRWTKLQVLFGYSRFLNNLWVVVFFCRISSVILENAFQTLGTSTNVTGPGSSYNDQVGGFYTAGSVFSRNKVVNANLMSLQMPHYRSGCGGIDLFMGG